MKNVKLLAISSVLSLMSLNAFAQESVCRDNNAGMDNGYTVTISADASSALVQETSIAGIQTVAELKCFEPATEQVRFPDMPTLVLSCFEPQLRDAGYSVAIVAGGLANLKSMTLSSTSLAGSKVIAKGICR